MSASAMAIKWGEIRIQFPHVIMSTDEQLPTPAMGENASVAVTCMGCGLVVGGAPEF